MFGILRLIHLCFISFYFFSGWSEERKTVFFYPCISLMKQVFVIHFFTVLQRLVQLYFTWVVLDSADSCKWFIACSQILVGWSSNFRHFFYQNYSLKLENPSVLKFWRFSDSQSGNFVIFQKNYGSWIMNFGVVLDPFLTYNNSRTKFNGFYKVHTLSILYTDYKIYLKILCGCPRWLQKSRSNISGGHFSNFRGSFTQNSTS